MKNSLDWQVAVVKQIKRETAAVKTFTLALPSWMPHRAGQHYDVRLTAEDGYRAQRSYSVASAPEREGSADLTVERIPDGEVSTYFHDVLVVGDRVELRGPIGGYFVWDAKLAEPVLLVAGGSGVVPLMSMIRHRAASKAKNPVVLLYSSRSLEDIIYSRELEEIAAAQSGIQVHYTLTRRQPPAWKGYSRRIDQEMLSDVASPLGKSARAFICGPTLMVESAADALLKLGYRADHIRTERFGPTGG